jgi:transposase-like protein
MCYFHVKKNVKDHVRDDNLLPKEKRDQLLKDLTTIHFSHNAQDYLDNLDEFKKKYYKHHRACYDYCATWFTGVWCNWQIFHNKPGQANTNSNIESFNNVIKKKYTNRTKLSLKSALLAIAKLILAYSTEAPIFEIYPKFEQKTKEFADSLDIRHFKKIGRDKFKYNSLKSDSEYIININDKQAHNYCNCSCKTFVKSGVCMHVVALSNIYNLNLFHPK